MLGFCTLLGRSWEDNNCSGLRSGYPENILARKARVQNTVQHKTLRSCMLVALFQVVLLISFLAVASANRLPPIAFVDVNVVPMDREIVLPHQTVVVENGKIVALGSTLAVKIPHGARRINGKGRYLMPGLVDMHVHFIRPSVPGQFQASASNNFELENQALALLYIANGVTTVRNMWGHPAIDAFAKEISSGRTLGPTIYSTGPITDGSPATWMGSRIVDTVEQAREAVRSDKEAGYVAIKVYDGLSKTAYETIVNEAREQHLAVVGHVPDAIGLRGARRPSGFDRAHLHTSV